MASQSNTRFSQTNLLHKDEDWYNGSIKSITLENFMCHSHFHLTFNPRVNFVSGLNGSGKSAIQTAIVVGFGARAHITNRGSALKNFIKFGNKSASISITIANGGTHFDSGPFKPEVYGNEITIVRQITETSSTFKILNDQGRSIRGFKHELNNLVLHFNILVDNPICVMNQAMVKQFHSSANSKTKYELFYKAISANVFQENIEETKLVALEYSEKFDSIKSVLTQCYKEVSDYETFEKKSKQLETLHKKKSQFENEYAWLVISRHEKTYEDYLNQIETLKCNISENADNTSTLNENIITLSEELKQKNIDLKIVDDSRSKNHFIYMNLIKELQNKTKEHEAAIQHIKKYDNTLKILILDKKDFEKHLEAEYQKGNTNTLAQYFAQIDSYEHKISEVEAAWKISMEHEQTLCNTVDNLKQRIGSLKNNEVTPLQRRVGELDKNINTMSHQRDRINFYGNWMPILVQAIKNTHDQNLFTKEPIGPIGAYIKVNDDKWIFSIENHLGAGNLRTFLVDNYADNKVLQTILDKVVPRNARKPTVITSKFVNKVHDISANETVNSMFRMLTFTNPIVANCLIDNNRIESIMLVDSTTEATPLMENASMVPRNCHFCLTLDGTQVYPNPSYRVYSLQHPSEPVLLQSDVSVAVNNLKREKQELEVKINNLNKEFLSFEQSKLEKQQHLNKTQTETKLLKSKYDEYTKIIIGLKSKCEEEQDDRVASIADEIKELDLKIAKTTKLKESVLQPINTIDSEINEINSKIKNMKTVIETTDRSAIMEKIEILQAKIGECKTNLSQINNNLAEQEQTLNSLIKKSENEKQLLIKQKMQTEQLSERIEVTHDAEDLRRKIEEISHTYKLLEMELKKRGEDSLVLRDEYKKKKEEYINHCSLYKQINEIYNTNQKSVDLSTTALQTHIQYIRLKVIESFDLVLLLRKIKGKLTIDLKEEQMEINMFDNISTSCASGGERTFATVALILALWSNMQLPFYSIDEYDVFMDNVNRMATTQLLLMAIENRKNQFIFLTPQDISHIKSGPNIKIVKLKEPRL